MQKEFNMYPKTVEDTQNCDNNVRIPPCIDDNFCVAAPMPRNGGVLAMAFVDMQPLDSVYSEELSFCNGTLFPNLDMPFFGGKNK